MGPWFIVADKPPGVTSHDVVAAFRAVTGLKKVGHTGTLDPFATGVLPLALGPATRLIQYLDETVKVYDATIQLGAATDTGDPTGEVVREAQLPTGGKEEVERILGSFLGEREQVPPAYSAVKVDGKPLYHYARKGIEKKAAARTIKLTGLDLISYDDDQLRVLITCSRGTYARVLADEIAIALGSAGHLCALSRTRSGPFSMDDAIDFPQLATLVAAEPGHEWQEVLLSRGPTAERVPWRPRADVRSDLAKWLKRPLDALSHLPLADVDAAAARRVRNGGPPPFPPPGTVGGARYLVVEGDKLVAVAEAGGRGPKTLRVVATSD